MVVLLSWLKDFVDIDVSIDVLCDKLVKAGFEVDSVTDLSKSYQNIVVGKITQIEKHPNADKLLVCQVDLGKESVQIVTGAHNIAVGDVVPVCTDGAVLPSGKEIRTGDLRGVTSYGMFCGGSELGLTSADFEKAGVDGIFILDDKYPLGTDINEVLGTNDFLLDIELTANRPDCNSVIGMAREVAAVLNTKFKGLNCALGAKEGKVDDYVSVKVDATDLCPRYMAAAVTDVVVKPASELIRRRLRLIGLRPINNIVDITNYVLTEVGQPMHAFDSCKLTNNQIVVRRATDGETITTLDGKENHLSNENLVICDSDKPVALAGIMGGLDSGICDTTSTIIFESARFKRDNVRRTSRNLSIRSDSSSRFEKGIDFESQEVALARALQLIESEGAGKVVPGYIDVMSGKKAGQVLEVSADKIDSILGISIPVEEMVSILNRLQLDTVADGRVLKVSIPAYREDLTNENDVSEEIIRIYGYDNIVCAKLDGLEQTHGGRSEKGVWVNRIKELLSGAAGFGEIVSYSFIPADFADTLSLEQDDSRRNGIKILNPLSDKFAVMRTTLVYSMIDILSGNIARGNKNLKLYEIGRRYLQTGKVVEDGIVEPETLMIAQSGEGYDFYTLKAVIENIASLLNIDLTYSRNSEPFLHPGRQAEILLDGKYIGFIGEVHPQTAGAFKCEARLLVAQLDLDTMLENAKLFKPYKGISRFPAVSRDLAFVIDADTYAGELLDCVKVAAGELLESIKVFDVYAGKGVPDGKKSVALALSFRAEERTLKDKEIVEIVNKILNDVYVKLGGTLRE